MLRSNASLILYKHEEIYEILYGRILEANIVALFVLLCYLPTFSGFLYPPPYVSFFKFDVLSHGDVVPVRPWPAA